MYMTKRLLMTMEIANIFCGNLKHDIIMALLVLRYTNVIKLISFNLKSTECIETLPSHYSLVNK